MFECLGFNGEVTGVWALWRRVEARVVQRWEWEVMCKWAEGVGEVDGHGRKLTRGAAVGLGFQRVARVFVCFGVLN